MNVLTQMSAIQHELFADEDTILRAARDKEPFHSPAWMQADKEYRRARRHLRLKLSRQNVHAEVCRMLRDLYKNHKAEIRARLLGPPPGH